MITSKAQLTRAIREAETAASLLRSPGHRFHGAGERDRIATLLEELANIARRKFDPNWRKELDARAPLQLVPSTAETEEYSQAELDDFGVAQ
jgi:hypothetical protein